MLMIDNVVTYVMCDACQNFTLCVDCFMSDKYSHHPAHSFTLKNQNVEENSPQLKDLVARLAPGRGIKHRAHCDECKSVFKPSST